ncbi:MAG: iron ABC transporter permease, partial [Betaproteobacteria bacterium]
MGALPLAVMLGRSLWVDHQLSAQRYTALFGASAHAWHLLGNSLTLAAVTATASGVIGLLAGIILGKTDLPLRGLFVVTLTLPLVIPPYLLGIAWTALLARDGLIGQILPSLADQLYGWLFGLPGCVWILFCAYMPIVMLLTIVAVRTVNPRLEEAARLACGWRVVLPAITLPLARSGIAHAVVLVFLLSLGEVTVPLYLRYPVFPVETLIQFSALYDFGAAAAAAVPLLLIAVLVIVLEQRWFNSRPVATSPKITSARPLIIALGRGSLPVFLAVTLIAALTSALPLLGLLWASATWRSYLDAFRMAWDSMARSLIYGAIAATILTVLGFFCGYLINRRSLPAWRLLDTTTLCLFATPGSVIAIGLISLWNHPAMNFIYGSAAIIVLGYTAQYLVLTNRVASMSLASVPESLEQAARIGGAGWIATVRSILLPAIRPGLVAAWLIAFVFCLRDVGITMLLYPPGADTLPVRILTLMANGAPELIAALSVCMVALTLIPLVLIALY